MSGIAQAAYKILFFNCLVYRLLFLTIGLSQRHHKANWHPSPGSNTLLMNSEPNICGKHCATSKVCGQWVHPQLNPK